VVEGVRNIHWDFEKLARFAEFGRAGLVTDAPKRVGKRADTARRSARATGSAADSSVTSYLSSAAPADTGKDARSQPGGTRKRFSSLGRDGSSRSFWHLATWTFPVHGGNRMRRQYDRAVACEPVSCHFCDRRREPDHHRAAQTRGPWPVQQDQVYLPLKLMSMVLEEVVVRTAFFRRIKAVEAGPDGWALQGMNRRRVLRYSWRERLHRVLGKR